MRDATWEYKVLSMTSDILGGGEDTVEPLLDEWGGAGWELVGVDPSATPTLYLFKRPVPPPAREEGDEEADEDYDEDYGDDYDEDGTIKVGPHSPMPPMGRR